MPGDRGSWLTSLMERLPTWVSQPASSLLLPASLLLLCAAGGPPTPVHYTAEGALSVPRDYREWVYLSSGLDMSYDAKASAADHSMFDNVFVDPQAWAIYKQSGHWPDKTVFAMENRGAATRGSINKRGQFQTADLMGLEFHVRDDARFKGGWAFFASNGGDTAPMLPAGAECYSCHRAHGAVDTTFTQFYPTAKPIAQQAGNYREE